MVAAMRLLVATLAVAAIALLFASGSEGPPPAAAARAIDPNDPAMVLTNTTPCVATCWRTNVTYGRATSALNRAAGKQRLALDLYRSGKTPRRDAPVIVLLHGGGFVTGDRSDMRLVGEALARSGYLVASIQYRLVPADRNQGAGIVKSADLIPASAEAEADAERAMRWIRAHAKGLGASTTQQRYAVGGYSAGAIAALRVGVRGGDESTAKARRWRVGAAFAISGSECGTWTKALHCSAAYDDQDAPLLMFHGEADSVVSFTWGQATCTAAVLRGGGCTGYYYPGQDHFWASGTIFGGAKDLTKKHPAIVPTIAAFLEKTLPAKG